MRRQVSSDPEGPGDAKPTRELKGITELISTPPHPPRPPPRPLPLHPLDFLTGVGSHCVRARRSKHAVVNRRVGFTESRVGGRETANPSSDGAREGGNTLYIFICLWLGTECEEKSVRTK